MEKKTTSQILATCFNYLVDCFNGVIEVFFNTIKKIFEKLCNTHTKFKPNKVLGRIDSISSYDNGLIIKYTLNEEGKKFYDSVN